MRRTPALFAAATLTLALSGCDVLTELAASSDTANADPQQSTRVHVDGMRDTLASLPVEPEWTGDYDRDRWSHWTQQDGCDTREVVMYEQGVYVDASGTVQARHARRDPDTCEVYDPGAAALEGGTNRWISPYDGQVFTDASELDADHLVALGEAADSGGHAWSEARKEDYANTTLILAVSASANRSKSDHDVTEWLPDQHQCRYTARWLRVKAHWQLSVDQAEHDALAALVERCRQ